MAPWQVDKARRALGRLDRRRARPPASPAIAAADFEVKGGGRDPVYAVERCVLTITGQHARNRALIAMAVRARRHPTFWRVGCPTGNFDPCVRA